MLAQVSECSRRLTNSGFGAPGGQIFKPGDDILDVHKRPPLGPCTATVHLMGFWYDKTKHAAAASYGNSTKTSNWMDQINVGIWACRYCAL